MQPVPICLLSAKRSEETFENTLEKSQTNATNVTASPQANDLTRHLKTHTGEKSNKCNQCDFATSHAGNLRTHLNIQHGEK